MTTNCHEVTNDSGKKATPIVQFSPPNKVGIAERSCVISESKSEETEDDAHHKVCGSRRLQHSVQLNRGGDQRNEQAEVSKIAGV